MDFLIFGADASLLDFFHFLGHFLIHMLPIEFLSGTRLSILLYYSEQNDLENITAQKPIPSAILGPLATILELAGVEGGERVPPAR